MSTDNQSLPCEPFQHDWREVYDGFKCCKCDHFAPFGTRKPMIDGLPGSGTTPGTELIAAEQSENPDGQPYPAAALYARIQGLEDTIRKATDLLHRCWISEAVDLLDAALGVPESITKPGVRWCGSVAKDRHSICGYPKGHEGRCAWDQALASADSTVPKHSEIRSES